MQGHSNLQKDLHYLDSLTCRQITWRGPKKKKRKKSETRIKAAAGGGEGNTPAFYTLGCNYITAEIFLCTTGIQAHTHTLAPAHIGDIIRA